MRIFYVADSHKHFASALEEYKKRLWKTIEWIAISPEKNGGVAQIQAKETEKIITHLKKHAGYTILLDIGNEQKDTPALEQHIAMLQMKYGNINWVIGGAWGVDKNLIKPHIREYFSLSQLTFPHSLALLLLAEQLYRVNTIQKNIPYHH